MVRKCFVLAKSLCNDRFPSGRNRAGEPFSLILTWCCAGPWWQMEASLFPQFQQQPFDGPQVNEAHVDRDVGSIGPGKTFSFLFT